MRVGLLHHTIEHAPSPGPASPSDALYELEHLASIETYRAALAAHGHEVFPIEGDVFLAQHLKELGVEICFNACEGYRGESREAQVPAMLEMLGLPYTGSKILALALTLDKTLTKKVLNFHGLPTPAFQLFNRSDETISPALKFPLFAKPNSEGTGIGIDTVSILHDEDQLRQRVAYLLEAYQQPVLVERFIDGPDVTVGMVGNWPELHLFPVLMIDPQTYEQTGIPVYGSTLKVDRAEAYRYHCPAPLSIELTAQLKQLAIDVMRITGVLDFARIDFRLDHADHDRPYILEINALPGITPISDLTLMAQADGWSHADLVYSVFEATLKRLGLQLEMPAFIQERQYAWVKR